MAAGSALCGPACGWWLVTGILGTAAGLIVRQAVARSAAAELDGSGVRRVSNGGTGGREAGCRGCDCCRADGYSAPSVQCTLQQAYALSICI